MFGSCFEILIQQGLFGGLNSNLHSKTWNGLKWFIKRRLGSVEQMKTGKYSAKPLKIFIASTPRPASVTSRDWSKAG
jgi:hypothetical protein